MRAVTNAPSAPSAPDDVGGGPNWQDPRVARQREIAARGRSVPVAKRATCLGYNNPVFRGARDGRQFNNPHLAQAPDPCVRTVPLPGGDWACFDPASGAADSTVATSTAADVAAGQSCEPTFFGGSGLPVLAGCGYVCDWCGGEYVDAADCRCMYEGRDMDLHAACATAGRVCTLLRKWLATNRAPAFVDPTVYRAVRQSLEATESMLESQLGDMAAWQFRT